MFAVCCQCCPLSKTPFLGERRRKSTRFKTPSKNRQGSKGGRERERKRLKRPRMNGSEIDHNHVLRFPQTISLVLVLFVSVLFQTDVLVVSHFDFRMCSCRTSKFLSEPQLLLLFGQILLLFAAAQAHKQAWRSSTSRARPATGCRSSTPSRSADQGCVVANKL